MTFPSDVYPTPWELPNTAAIYAESKGDYRLDTAAAWALANRIVYAPVRFVAYRQPAAFGIVNGAAVSGALRLGLYAPDSEGKPGTRLIHCPATVQAGTTAAQFLVPNEQINIGPGFYYVAVQFNNATGQVRQVAALTTAGEGPSASVFTEDAASFILPATATPSSSPVASPLPLVYVL